MIVTGNSVIGRNDGRLPDALWRARRGIGSNCVIALAGDARFVHQCVGDRSS